MLTIIKKDGTKQPFQPEKIITAIGKSASRLNKKLNDFENNFVWQYVEQEAIKASDKDGCISVPQIHNIVEGALERIAPDVAKSYRDYRNYKTSFVAMLDEVYKKSQSIMYIGDKENSNTDSALVSTKRSLIFNQLNKELYSKFFLTTEEKQAVNEGYIYVHDMSARRDTMNCFHRSTRFITNRGVKSFYDFQDGEKIIVLTHKGNWKKAVVHSYGYQKVQKINFKRASGNIKSVICTKNHRWILKDGSETTNLKVGDKLIPAPNITDIDWEHSSKEEKLLWCIGFGFAHRFEDCGYTVTYPKSLNGDAFVRLTNIHTKDIPWLIVNYNNVKYLVDGWLCADGNVGLYKSNKYRSLQVTGDTNKFIYDLLNVSGYYVTNITNMTGQSTNYGIRTRKTLSYGFHSNQSDMTWVVDSIEPYYTNGNTQVWCLEVEDDHSFILENGIPTGNCCLFDVKNVLSGGFEMGNIWYNEPKTLDTAFDVIGDIVLSAASQQYGGFTVPEVDKLLAPYAEKSYQKYLKKYLPICVSEAVAKKTALEDVQRDFEQGFQGWEYKFNTVSSSRGDYPFTTMTLGLGTKPFEKMAAITFLRVRMEGQGKKGYKRPVLFPKLVFLYDENLHGKGCPSEDVFETGINCSAVAMYPDWLSLTGEGYVPSMYKKYGKVVSPMGCRAFLSPWYERGGMEPADENDEPIFVGRFNIGAISLHLPMILAKARQESRDFYEVLDYYMEIIRKLHLRTYDYLGEMRASTNPLAYCEGGFYGGNLSLHDKIKPILKSATASFGVTALNELQRLYNGKPIREDGQFCLEVMEYINKKLSEYKKQDGRLYAVYGTPAESLCGKQIDQFRAIYGIVENVSDRAYVSNSFHCHVTEDMSPIEKQDKEARFWNLFNGGKIQYVKYPISYNKEAIKTLVRRAMAMGFYEGVNLALAYCNECGHQELSMDVCPKCGSRNLTKIERMNGYLSYSRVNGDTRLNSAKMAEIADRKSM